MFHNAVLVRVADAAAFGVYSFSLGLVAHPILLTMLKPQKRHKRSRPWDLPVCVV